MKIFGPFPSLWKGSRTLRKNFNFFFEVPWRKTKFRSSLQKANKISFGFFLNKVFHWDRDRDLAPTCILVTFAYVKPTSLSLINPGVTLATFLSMCACWMFIEDVESLNRLNSLWVVVLQKNHAVNYIKLSNFFRCKWFFV